MNAKRKIKHRFEDLPRDYFGLVSLLPPRPIHDEADLSNVLEITDAMALWAENFTPDQEDYFEALCSFIEKYEAEHVKWPKVSGVDALKHLLDENGMKAADLARLLGVHRNLGSSILRGERKLTAQHIRALAAHFNLSTDVFHG